MKRSLITLKALTYAPTGGIVAAATTSLPEQLGGVRNWDYRYCWLRDATFTILALMKLGYHEEARAWRDWLDPGDRGKPASGADHVWRGRGAVAAGIGPPLAQGLCGLLARCGLETRPAIRCRSMCSARFADAMFQAYKAGMAPTVRGRALRTLILEYLAETWRKPDEGIWEVRGGPQHFVHSKVMAWVAFDRAADDVGVKAFHEPGQRWRAIADEIHAEVCERGFDRELDSFVQAYGSKRLDASLLSDPACRLPSARRSEDPGNSKGDREQVACSTMNSFCGTNPTTPATASRSGEGAFLACSFWLVDNYILQDRYEDARRLFERLLARCNDVGLLAEELDPASGRMLGNFPQAYSHVGLINCALNLSHRAGPVDERAASRSSGGAAAERSRDGRG